MDVYLLYNMAMETIFDHKPTQAELADLLPSPITKAEYMAMPMDQDSEFGRIYSLYSLRGDLVNADSYLQKIANAEYKANLLNVDTL